MREVITLQFGAFANFVGTHFWNAQLAYFPAGNTSADDGGRGDPPSGNGDGGCGGGSGGDGDGAAEVAMDVLFRSRTTLRGQETFTPRVLVFDLKDNFGSVKRTAALFEADADAPISNTWLGDVQHHQHEQLLKNQYLTDLDAYETAETLEDIQRLATKTYDLDDTVQYWSDFNSVFYHPRSLHQVPQSQDGASELVSFDAGCESFSVFQKEHAVYDEAIRFFAEECDSLQGFHTIVDTHDGFSGFHARFLEDLRDEFPKAAVITSGVSHPPVHWQTDKNLMDWKWINRARALVHSSELSTLYIPLEFPKFPMPADARICGGLDPKLRYHTGALLSAVLDSVSLPYRKHSSSLSMSSLLDHVSHGGRYQMASMSTSFPLQAPPSTPKLSRGTPIVPSPKSYTFGGEELHKLTRKMCPILFFRFKDEVIYSQYAVLRGGDLLLEPVSRSARRTSPQSSSELLDEYLASSDALSNVVTLKQIVETPFPLVQAFPRIKTGLPDSSACAVPSLSMLQSTSRLEELPRQFLEYLANCADANGGTGNGCNVVGGGAASWCGRELKLSTSAYRDLAEGLNNARERYARS